MSNSLSKFYIDQAGSGIDVFSGYNHQKGNGYFGRFYARSIKPLLSSFVPVLKDTAVHGAGKVVQHLSNEIKAAKRKSKPRRVSNPRKKSKKKQVTEKNYF